VAAVVGISDLLLNYSRNPIHIHCSCTVTPFCHLSQINHQGDS
jgi:hypothetical protein